MAQDCPIVIVDDEYRDICELESILNITGRRMGFSENIVEYFESCEEAVEFMQDQKSSGKGVSALITDNHIGTSTIDGDEFLRVVTGHLPYCFSRSEQDAYLLAENFKSVSDIQSKMGRRNQKISDFVEEMFGSFKEYISFYNYFYGLEDAKLPTIMLCGHPAEANLGGLPEVYLFGKSSRLGGRVFCEKEVLAIFQDLGIFSRESTDYAIKKNPRISNPDPKKQRYNPCSNRINKMVTQRIDFSET